MVYVPQKNDASDGAADKIGDNRDFHSAALSQFALSGREHQSASSKAARTKDSGKLEPFLDGFTITDIEQEKTKDFGALKAALPDLEIGATDEWKNHKWHLVKSAAIGAAESGVAVVGLGALATISIPLVLGVGSAAAVGGTAYEAYKIGAHIGKWITAGNTLENAAPNSAQAKAAHSGLQESGRSADDVGAALIGGVAGGIVGGLAERAAVDAGCAAVGKLTSRMAERKIANETVSGTASSGAVIQGARGEAHGLAVSNDTAEDRTANHECVESVSPAHPTEVDAALQNSRNAHNWTNIPNDLGQEKLDQWFGNVENYVRNGSIKLQAEPGLFEKVTEGMARFGSGDNGVVYSSQNERELYKTGLLHSLISQKAALQTLREQSGFTVPNTSLSIDPEVSGINTGRGVLRMEKMEFDSGTKLKLNALSEQTPGMISNGKQLANPDAGPHSQLFSQARAFIGEAQKILRSEFSETEDLENGSNWGVSKESFEKIQRGEKLNPQDIIIFDPAV